jgi:hypothetical protein
MNFFDRFFGHHTDPVEPLEPKIRFGRYTDSYKTEDNYTAWRQSLDLFEKDDFLDSYQAFFVYLRDVAENNVSWVVHKDSIQFEILQGSKKIMGTATPSMLKAHSYIAHAKSLNVGLLRRLMEGNFILKYCRYALDEDNNVLIMFDTPTLDGSPHKLYHALKELAINADKQDDLLIDEFADLTLVDSGSRGEFSEDVKQSKYAFFRKETTKVLDLIDKGSLDAGRYPSGICYLLLHLSYKLDYLVRPEGVVMDSFERMHRLFVTNDGKSLSQINELMRKELEKLLTRSADTIKREFYDTTATFGVLHPKGHSVLVESIEKEMPKMEWYLDNKHLDVALAIPGYVVGNALFYFGLPKPDKQLLEFYFRILETSYFESLGFSISYYNETTKVFDGMAIKTKIKKIADANKVKYPKINPDTNILDFSSPHAFAHTYLDMIKKMDLSE